MKDLISIALLYLAVVGHAQEAKGGSSSVILPLCTVVSDSAKYEGKAIVVSGLYRFVIHGAVLMDPSCPKIEVNLRNGVGYRTNKQAAAVMRSLTKRDQFRAVDVVLRGTLHVAHEGQCLGEVCAPYEIEVIELISARAAPDGTSALSSPFPGTLSHEADHAQGTRAP